MQDIITPVVEYNTDRTPLRELNDLLISRLIRLRPDRYRGGADGYKKMLPLYLILCADGRTINQHHDDGNLIYD